ncbi:glutathione reductase [Hamiltosporidium tvaerminnensis]|uniref:Glutathione reductase n=1 Tax=Hamiltosporidium tvaerminnensis TaxID=1176355 RepID=A0A4Q9LBL3_9MICR|nr:glutathione reductase [Hamiltosporidium tvaerminnensis]
MYDLIVIGAGSGGLSAAIKSKKMGKKVLLIEKARIGGTCVNVGCVPKKITYNLSNLLFTLKFSQFYGISISEYKIDFEKFVKKRNKYIERLNNIYKEKIKDIEYVEGHAIVENDQVIVNEKCYTYKNLLLATGSKSIVPEIPGKEYLFNSDDFFELKERPDKVVIIGSGYIGIEMSFMFVSLGSEVSIICRKNAVLSKFDKMISENVILYMKEAGIRIFFDTEIERIEKIEKKYKLTFKNKEENFVLNDIDFPLCAIGRDSDLSFIKSKIEKNGNFLKVNENFKTSIKNVYAIGDIINNYMLTPVAIFCGRSLVDHIFESKYKNIEQELRIFECVPSVVFSHPPVATVGLSEEEARRKYSEKVKIYKSRFVNLYFSMSDIKEYSEYKIVVVEDKVIGIHICGLGSDEIIQGFAVAIKNGLNYNDLKNCIGVHPTASEELLFTE